MKRDYFFSSRSANICSVLEKFELPKEDSCWLQCVNPQFNSFIDWVKCTKTFLTKILSQMSASHKEVFVVCLFSNESLDKIGELMKDIYAAMHGISQFVVIYTDEQILKELVKSVKILSSDKKWNNYVVKMNNWEDMNPFIDELCFGTQQTEITVPLTNGMSCTIKPQVAEFFVDSKLEVIGINKCHNLDESNAEGAIEKYLQGHATWPDWDVFHYDSWKHRPNHVMSGIIRREIVDRILRDVKQLAKKEFRCVALKKLLHQPGAGASTAAMNALWDLRKEFKSVRINGDDFGDLDRRRVQLDNLSKQIIFLRSLGEPKTVEKGFTACNPVFILLDNANKDLAIAFRKSLEDYVQGKGIIYQFTMFIILYLVQKVDITFRPEDESKADPSDTLVMKQELSLSEKESFQKFLTQGKIEPTKMLEFVIMANNFESTPYVKQTVKNTLKSIHTHQNQEKLLLYLSLLKNYVGMSLPVDHCRYLLEGFPKQSVIDHGPPPINLLSSLSSQAKILLSQRTRYIDFFSERIKTQVLEFSHLPAAKEVLLYLKKDKKLPDILSNLLAEVPSSNAEKNLEEYIFFCTRMILSKTLFYHSTGRWDAMGHFHPKPKLDRTVFSIFTY
jgi:hypothetical protein